MALIQLDRPRKLKFGFNALEFIETKLEIDHIDLVFKLLENGKLSIIKTLLEACMIGDNINPTISSDVFGDMLDEYLDKHGLDKLTEVLKATIEESSFANASKKQMEKDKKKKNK